MAKVTIGEVAKAAGVSLGTVSNALNHPDKVKPETLTLVNEAISRLGYVPNQAARQLAGSENRMFGLVLPRLDHAFSLQIASGAQAEARAYGYGLLVANAGNDDILTNHYMRYFMGAQVAGVLVQPMVGTAWKPPLEMPPVPTVYLDVHGSGPGNYIAADNVAQGRLMLEHALSCEARAIAVVGKAQFMQLALRVQGIEDAAAGLGVQVERIDRGDWNTAEDGFKIGRALAGRKEGNQPDFVIALTDVLAAGVIDGLLDAGLSVPGDVFVAGCDGNPLAWGGSVPLTTLSSPGYEIGRRGVQLLLLPEGEGGNCTRQELIGSTLISRASTAAMSGPRTRESIPELNLGEYL